MRDEWTLILLREPFMPNMTWYHPTKPSAQVHAYNLSLKYKCDLKVINVSRRIYVFAKASCAKETRNG